MSTHKSYKIKFCAAFLSIKVVALQIGECYDKENEYKNESTRVQETKREEKNVTAHCHCHNICHCCIVSKEGNKYVLCFPLLNASALPKGLSLVVSTSETITQPYTTEYFMFSDYIK